MKPVFLFLTLIMHISLIQMSLNYVHTNKIYIIEVNPSENNCNIHLFDFICGYIFILYYFLVLRISRDNL